MLPTRLTALVVNHDAGLFALAAVRSLRRQWWLAGGRREDLDVIVWDNGSQTGQGDWLMALEAEGARVFGSIENHGFAGGLQRAFDQSDGGSDDLVLILQPDTVLAEGAIATLVEFLETHPVCGAVAPTAFVDEQLQLELHGSRDHSACAEWVYALSRRSGWIAKRFAALRTRRALWARSRSSQGELQARPSLAGIGALLLPRQVVEDLGRLGDPRFPLFYEEEDLCRRIRARGLELVRHPDARLAHFGGVSVHAASPTSLMRRRVMSRRAFQALHLNHLGRLMVRFADRWISGADGDAQGRLPSGVRVLAAGDEPPALSLGPGRTWRVEISRGADLYPWAVAPEVEGGWQLSRDTWHRFQPGRYVFRAVDARTGRAQALWTCTKTAAAREEPVWEPVGEPWEAAPPRSGASDASGRAA